MLIMSQATLHGTVQFCWALSMYLFLPNIKSLLFFFFFCFLFFCFLFFVFLFYFFLNFILFLKDGEHVY